MKIIKQIIKEEVKKLFINEGYYDDKGIVRLYHRIGSKLNLTVPELIKSVYEKGLIPKDNGEIGEVIWFSDDYSDYAKNGKFVVAVDFDTATNGYSNNEYGMRYDGHNGYASKAIPFDKLIIIKIPVLTFSNGHVSTNEEMIEFINGNRMPITPEDLNNNSLKPVIYADVFSKYVQPHINYPNFIEELDTNSVKIINVLERTY